MDNKAMIRSTGRSLATLAGLLILLGAALHPAAAWAVDCGQVLSAGETGTDTDQDGYTDYQECSGITTVGSTQITFPWCGSTNADGAFPSRDRCVDPDSKDLFVILAPPANAAPSLLPQDFSPFGPVSAYGVTFIGLNALGLAVHQLKPEEAHVDRLVTSAVLSLPQMKAVKITESLDTNGTILGYCQWGTPLGLDGCVVYTQRTRDFIASTCGSATIQTQGGAPSTADAVLKAYSTYLILHETGHSLGGLTAEYNSRFGGYHYKPGAGLVMEQAVTYTVKGGKCTFHISPNWNQTLDAPAIKLK